VTEGIGLCQRCSGLIEVIRPGDCMFFELGNDHWHGAVPDHFVIHPAMLEVDDAGNSVTWGEHVTNQEYSPRVTRYAAVLCRQASCHPFSVLNKEGHSTPRLESCSNCFGALTVYSAYYCRRMH